MGRHSKKKPRTASVPTEEQSFYGIIAAGARDGELWVRKRVRRFAALQGKKPKEYENLRCSTDLDGDKRRAGSLKRSYDELSKEYRKALTPVRE